ncbi:MAG: 30S ribosomal protein S17, partial [Phycisphaerae bacterium]
SAAVAGRRPRKSRVGVVASDKRDKTIKVVCHYTVKHKKYGKYMGRRTSLHAHDFANEARTGDRVEVAECRSLSKTKHWRLVRIVKRA